MDTYTIFQELRQIGAGDSHSASVAANEAIAAGLPKVLIFQDGTGQTIEPAQLTQLRGPGRPKLGVVPREVTLLPRHWEWLGAQPGGASVALRKLVEQARRSSGGEDRIRLARESAYRFLTAIAGNLGGFEEALRALFAGERARFEAETVAWPGGVRDYALGLADASWVEPNV